MRVIVRRSVPVIVEGKVVQLVAGTEATLPDDIALALVRGMAASRIPDDAGAVASQPSVASTPSQAAAPAPKPKSTRRVK